MNRGTGQITRQQYGLQDCPVFPGFPEGCEGRAFEPALDLLDGCGHRSSWKPGAAGATYAPGCRKQSACQRSMIGPLMTFRSKSETHRSPDLSTASPETFLKTMAFTPGGGFSPKPLDRERNRILPPEPNR